MSVNLEQSILRVLMYFDIFQYPLSKEEIWFFLDRKSREADVADVLHQLTIAGIVFRHQEFYSVSDNPALRSRRLQGNEYAESLLRIASRISGFLYRFPYVRGIGISGSLSKHFAAPDADIDFFIITRSNRLWIARTIMLLLVKLMFLVKKEKWFCLNYYIDEEVMNIEEHNIFTATELITLMPQCGNGTMDRFFNANEWAGCYFPNAVRKNDTTSKSSPLLKRMIEGLFNNRLGNWLDDYLMKVTTRRWNRKEALGERNKNGKRKGLRTGKHFCKPNPEFFQKMILEKYREKLKDVEMLSTATFYGGTAGSR